MSFSPTFQILENDAVKFKTFQVSKQLSTLKTLTCINDITTETLALTTAVVRHLTCDESGMIHEVTIDRRPRYFVPTTLTAVWSDT